MPLPNPIQFTTDDGFQTVIEELPNGQLRVQVTGMVRRMWQAECATIEEATALAIRIRSEQAEVAEVVEASADLPDSATGLHVRVAG